MDSRCQHQNRQGICPLAGQRTRRLTPPRSRAERTAWRTRYLALSDQHQECSRCCRRQALRYEPTAIQRACHYIEEHFTEPLTVGMVAKHAGLCPQQFRKRFKQSTGQTFRQYLTQHRLDRAKELLLKPGYKIIYVSLDAGFQSLSSCQRAFRKYTGKTATKYRQKPH